ncbi:hypothetical protein EVAR_75266_1 [Eumeta japonica]|uniref:Uncharacterized protein n=1 Tax=Eumeta variegata TaxID=151549 RepID=A0A4C1V8A9_EUMVA|nr:hypothetical protein EVAR_75266_1 [Eumeta japonica]
MLVLDVITELVTELALGNSFDGDTRAICNRRLSSQGAGGVDSRSIKADQGRTELEGRGWYYEFKGSPSGEPLKNP